MSETGSNGIAAYDPLGNYVRHAAPVGSRPDFHGPASNGAWSTFTDPQNLSTGCTLDGQPIDCNRLMQDINHGNAAQCPNNDCGPRVVYDRQGQGHVDPLGFDPATGQLGYWRLERQQLTTYDDDGNIDQIFEPHWERRYYVAPGEQLPDIAAGPGLDLGEILRQGRYGRSRFDHDGPPQYDTAIEWWDAMLSDIRHKMNMNKQAWDEYINCVSNSAAAIEFESEAKKIPMFTLPIRPVATAIGRNAGKSIYHRITEGTAVNASEVAAGATRSFVFGLPFYFLGDNIRYSGAMQSLDKRTLAPRRSECMQRITGKYGFRPARPQW